MHPSVRIVLAGALFLATLVRSAPETVASTDTTTAHPATARAHSGIALASLRIGVRLATRIRFPAGIGLGLAVCTAGIVLEIDHYLRSR